MTSSEIRGRRMVGLFLLGLLFFNFPILSLFDQATLIFGIPVFFLYLFSVWLLFVLLLFVISQSTPHTQYHEDRR